MIFSDPRMLLLLAALPLLVLFEWLAIRRADRARTALAGPRATSVLLEQRRPGQRRASLALRLGAFALLVLGAAGPEWGRELVKRPAAGSDLLFLVDVSASMDVRDVAPSRLDEARREALAVLEHSGDSRVGVIAFAGDAVGLCPLTSDLASARLVVESLSSSTVSEPGTDLGRAFVMAARLLPPGRRDERVVVLWTDGEDLEHGAEQALGALERAGVRVFAVGVGTPAGDIVPELDSDGRTVDVKRDESGNAVRSRLDVALLRTIARRTHGGYFAASRPGGELPRLLGALGGLARVKRGERLVERPVARFPWFAAGAMALLLTFGLRARRRVPSRADAPEAAPGPAAGQTGAKRRTRRAPKRAVAATAALATLALALLPATAGAQSAWARGDQAFRAGRFADAESLYRKRSGKQGPPAVAVNRATALALAAERDSAARELQKYVGERGATGRNARFNLGTVQGEMGRTEEALRTLREALERDPSDKDARWNYEILLRRQASERSPQPDTPPEKQPPQPTPSQPQPNPQSPPQPDDSQQQPPPGSGNAPPPPQGGSGPQQMSREQAERLLAALQELQRADQQRRQKVRVLRERRGKDW